MPAFPDLTGPFLAAWSHLRFAAERDIPEILIAHQDDPELYVAPGPRAPAQRRRARAPQRGRGRGPGDRPGRALHDPRARLGHVRGPARRAPGRLGAPPRRGGHLGRAPALRGRGMAAAALRLAARWLFEAVRAGAAGAADRAREHGHVARPLGGPGSPRRACCAPTCASAAPGRRDHALAAASRPGRAGHGPGMAGEGLAGRPAPGRAAAVRGLRQRRAPGAGPRLPGVRPASCCSSASWSARSSALRAWLLGFWGSGPTAQRRGRRPLRGRRPPLSPTGLDITPPD